MHEITHWIIPILFMIISIFFCKKNFSYFSTIKELQIELAVLKERLLSKEMYLSDILQKHTEQSDELANKQIIIEQMKATITAFETEKTLLRKELENHFHKISEETLRMARTDLFTNFQQHWNSFIKQERTTWEEKETQLKHWISPIQKELEALKQVHHTSQKELASTYQGIKDQLKSQCASSSTLEKETKKLCDILKNPNAKGRWGEMQLRRIVELCGLLPYCDFQEQTTYDGKRPDLTIRLPGDKCLIIDAKTPIKDLWDETQDNKNARKEQTSNIKKHVQAISKRNYWSVQDRPIMVIIFFPVDSILGTAMEADPTILEWSATHNVLLTTPSTLIGLLMTISTCWMQQKSADNAQYITQKSKDILDVITLFFQDVLLLGRHLEKTVDAFNSVVKTSKTKLIPSFEELKDLIGPSAKKTWVHPKQISYPLE